MLIKIFICILMAISCKTQGVEQGIGYEEGAVFITLTRTAEKIEKLPTNITVITAKDIKNYGYQTLGEVLDHQVNFSLYKIGTLGSLTTPRLRGAGAAHVLILVDGRPHNGISLATAMRQDITDIIPLSSIERIEIIRGASSCLYGANAMAGVINIITKKAKSEKPKLEFSTQLESFDTHMYKLSFEKKSKLLSYFINAEKDVTAGWRQNSDYDKFSIFAKLNLNLNKFGDVELNINNLFSNLGVPGMNMTPITQWDNKKERTATSPKARLDKKNTSFQLKYKLNIKDKKISAQTYMTDEHLNYTDPDAWELTDKKSLNNSRQFGIETSINVTPNVTAGLSFHTDSINQEYPLSPKDNFKKSANNIGLFAEFSLPKELIPKLSLITSIRYDLHSMFGGFLNYRISAIYPLLKSLELSTNFGTAHRAPTFLDLYWPATPWSKGNPNLKPEKGVTFDIGMRYRITNSVLEITFYQHEYKDLIRWVLDATGVWMPQNVDLGKTQGVEISISQSLTPYLLYNFNLSSLYNLVKTNPAEEYKLAAYSPLYKANYSLILQPGLGFSIIPTISYESEKYTGDGKTGTKIQSYTIFDINLTKSIGIGRIYFKVNNIFDTRYLRRANYPLPGRYYAGGIEISF